MLDDQEAPEKGRPDPEFLVLMADHDILLADSVLMPYNRENRLMKKKSVRENRA